MFFRQSASRIQRVRHELEIRDVSVSAVERLSPGFIAVDFHAASLARFVSPGFDDHVKFMFADTHGERVRRDYTPRAFDRDSCRLRLEFALHDHGPAAAWALRARVGDAAVIGGPKGSQLIPTDFDWHVLAGDASALPAIHRRLEELPDTASGIAVIHIDHPDDRRLLPTLPNMQVHWVEHAAEVHARITSWRPERGNGFAWVAGEAALARGLRDQLSRQPWIDTAHLRAAAYWRRGQADFHQRLE